ncbi:Hypothetical predicted protein, partial [Podarcis lilfordi]
NRGPGQVRSSACTPKIQAVPPPDRLQTSGVSSAAAAAASSSSALPTPPKKDDTTRAELLLPTPEQLFLGCGGGGDDPDCQARRVFSAARRRLPRGDFARCNWSAGSSMPLPFSTHRRPHSTPNSSPPLKMQLN